MAGIIPAITLITQLIMKLPLMNQIVRDIIAAAGEAIKKHDAEKFAADLAAAEKKAKETKDTSDLEKLMGRK